MKYEVILNGKKYEVEVEKGSASITSETAYAAPVQDAAPAVTAAAPAVTKSGAGTPVTAPLPGTVLDVKVSNGQTVKSGDILVIIEAMKMENEIAAPQDGTVSSVAVSKGQSVESGTPLVFLA